MTSDHLIVAMQQQWGSATMQQEPPVIPEGNAVQSYLCHIFEMEI